MAERTKITIGIVKQILKTLLLGVISFLLIQKYTYSQESKGLLPYLQQNSIDLNQQEPAWEQVLDSSFYKNDIYWLGEKHGVANNYAALYQYVKHLKTKTNFKYYLLETPYFWEVCLNKYFKTGDEKFLKAAFQSSKGTFYYNQEFFDFYRKLYAFNQTLSEANRIVFVSIDIEQQQWHADERLREMLKNRASDLDSTHFLAKFLKNQFKINGELWREYGILQEKINQNPAEIERVMGNDADTFKYYARNIDFATKVKINEDDALQDLLRDSLMFENFKWRDRQLNLKQGKVFAFFGLDHTYLDDTPNTNHVAAFVRKSGFRSNTTIFFYSDCEFLVPAHYYPKFIRNLKGKDKKFFTTSMMNNDGFLMKRSQIKSLKNTSKSDITIFKLDASASPFGQKHFLANDIKTDLPTTNYFQNAILIRNSKAVKPLEK